MDFKFEDKTLTVLWTIEDVMKLRPDLTCAKAEKALIAAYLNYNPDQGITTNTFKFLSTDWQEK